MLKAGFVLGGKYEILSVIGKGGTSTVYLAVHQKLHQKWAVKEINKEYCENYGMISRRLIAEADILKKLDHPGLPKIIDIIEEYNTIWLIMEFIEGTTLKEIINRERRIEEGKVLDWGLQLCQVLEYLHTREPSVIYRDVKPSNIMIKKTGKLVLIDFGTAREISCTKGTRDAVYLGTRGYAAPEQYGKMGQTDCRTDIYGMGMTFYHMLTGHNPERAPYKMCPLDEWERYASEKMQEVIMKCTQYDPQNRYQNCEELLTALLQMKRTAHGQHRKRKIKTRVLMIGVTGVFVTGIFFCTAFKHIGYYYREKKALSYVSAAEKSIGSAETENNYRKALQEAPDSGKVYDSLLDYFIKPEKFKMKDAAALTNLLITDTEGEPALDILKKNKMREYGEVCYEIGLGYFYDIGGVVGKKMAESWFRDAEVLGDKNFDNAKGRRAKLYADICNYYNTFLTNGKDKSGERKQKDFYDFYKTLYRLNKFQITEQSTDSDISAAWLISKEVAVELVNYGEGFSEHEKITEEMLKRELEKIKDRKEYFKNRKDREEIYELDCLVKDAERKLETLSGK